MNARIITFCFDFGAGGFDVRHLNAQSGRIEIAVASAVEGDDGVPVDKFAPHRRLRIDLQSNNVTIEGHGAVHVLDHKHVFQ